MGGMGNNDVEKENKIIHNISKNVVVEKQIFTLNLVKNGVSNNNISNIIGIEK